MSDEARCRGWLLSGVVDYLDEAQQRELRGRASPGVRAFLEKPKKQREDWVPIDWTIETLTLADSIAGNGDLSLAWPIGAFVARQEVGAVQELALKVLRPAIIMSLASGLWVMHYRNAGRVVARGRADRDMIVSFVDVPRNSRAMCLSIGGWMEGFLGLGARRNIQVRQAACRADGAAQCEFHVTWDE